MNVWRQRMKNAALILQMRVANVTITLQNRSSVTMGGVVQLISILVPLNGDAEFVLLRFLHDAAMPENDRVRKAPPDELSHGRLAYDGALDSHISRLKLTGSWAKHHVLAFHRSPKIGNTITRWRIPYSKKMLLLFLRGGIS